MERCNYFRPRGASRSLIPGLILTVVGVLFLLENLNVIYVEDWWSYWPALVIAVGFAKLVDNFRVLRRASN